MNHRVLADKQGMKTVGPRLCRFPGTCDRTSERERERLLEGQESEQFI